MTIQEPAKKKIAVSRHYTVLMILIVGVNKC